MTHATPIRYISTAGQAPAVSFEDALFAGLAPDGGLYVPDRLPQFTAVERAALRGLPLPEVGRQVLAKWLAAEIAPETLAAIARDAQHFPIPIRLVDGIHVVELFHGPTMAFKDVAAQYLPRLMNAFLSRSQREITVLVATSGDTGGAIAHGFADVPGMSVYVLFPKGRVSRLQEEQLTRVADNVTPVAIDGYFDDCQALVKRAFTDPTLAMLNLTSANSISIGRLLPQIIYYVYLRAQLEREDLTVIVPSGNFGNLTAGLYAQAMGIRFGRFVAATNRNDAVVRYLESGRFEPHDTVATMSTAMDVGRPSNFSRILHLVDHDHARLARLLTAERVDDATTVATIRRVHARHGYLLDPHTAVGWHVAQAIRGPRALIATASPAKFAHEIHTRTGLTVDDKAAIARLRTRPARRIDLQNDYDALRALLLDAA